MSVTATQAVKALYDLVYNQNVTHVSLKIETIRVIIEWLEANLNKKLLTKLGLSDITSTKPDELEAIVSVDQQKRTIERRKQQVKRAKRGKSKVT